MDAQEIKLIQSSPSLNQILGTAMEVSYSKASAIDSLKMELSPCKEWINSIFWASALSTDETFTKNHYFFVTKQKWIGCNAYVYFVAIQQKKQANKKVSALYF